MKNRITILGAGESGTGAALLAKAKGFDVFVSDMGSIQEKYMYMLFHNDILFESGKHTEEQILDAELVVKSPGIPEKADIVKKIRQKGIPIISEIEFAAKYTQAKFVAITGSNGKTTTTLLAYHMLKDLGLNVGLAGNIGDSLAAQVIEDRHEWYVLELSSFQLDDMYEFKADVAVLLNITKDHLDRYEYNFDNYINSKFRIIQNMKAGDHFIFFADDPVVNEEVQKREVKPSSWGISLKEPLSGGAWMELNRLFFDVNAGKGKFYLNTDELPLKGKHNMINVMAASLIAAVLGMNPSKFQQAINGFSSVSHRLEEVGEVNGVTFVNDSKATNVDAVWYALDSFPGNIVWIAGGVDKGNEYEQLHTLVRKRVKALVCMGKDNSQLKKAFDGIVKTIKETDNINAAVETAFQLANEGDVVLLSPACASFDLFKNYEDRGERFKKAVHDLARSVS
ncbi:UDP-N-acetylmuramoyl-L-alanine--D-glutamate ligase [Cytophagaceae bacterium ABcell3]|nr:UDP-N-acetylmuramoyl-L-alanine--D-glutamate ligase [Cytophagaceae bacterium ABcell3]